MTIERDNYLSYVGLNPESATTFFGINFFKVVDIGPADPERYKPEARRYQCYATEHDWLAELERRLALYAANWRKNAGAAVRDGYQAYNHCADEIEDLLRGIPG